MPSAPRPSVLTPALAAGVGAVGPLLLAATGAAEIVPALSAGVGAAILAALLARTLAPRPAVAEAAPAASAPAAPFEAAAEALPDPLLILAADADDENAAAARILFANAAARELLRIGEAGAGLVQAIRRPEALETIEESLFGRISRTTPFEIGGAHDRIWRLSATPLAADGSGRLFCLVVLHDETDARRNERMRADFLANASHELRTPLASLAGFIETLRGHAKDDPGARDRFLAIMAAQADRMRRLIEDLLSLSRIELNEHIPPSGSCDLAMAVDDVIDAMGPIAGEKKTRIDKRLTPRGGAVVTGDRDQLLQVVQNLLDNALKYSPPDEPVVVEILGDLSLDQVVAADPSSPRLGPGAEAGGRLPLVTPDRADAERYAAVRVTDHGPGMMREHLPRLAERFYRIEGQKSGERSGTGLGLAIVKHIVIRHRGGLMVESAPGRGTCFTVYLPLKVVSEIQPEPAAPPSSLDAA